MTYLSDGKYASPPDELTALVLEAHHRGVSYGQLVASTSQRELDEIIRAYCEGKVRNLRVRLRLEENGENISCVQLGHIENGKI